MDDRKKEVTILYCNNLPLEMKMSSLFIPTSDGGGDGVHGLDALHNPDWDSGWEVRDKGGSVFGFIVLSVANV